MKLNWKQTNLVIQMVFDKVAPTIIAKQQAEVKALRNKAEALVVAHSLHAKLHKLFSDPDFKEVEITNAALKAVYKWGSDFSMRDARFTSCHKFIDFMTDRYVSHYTPRTHKSEYQIKQDIEAKVLLSSLNVADLQSLIDSIVKLFK